MEELMLFLNWCGVRIARTLTENGSVKSAAYPVESRTISVPTERGDQAMNNPYWERLIYDDCSYATYGQGIEMNPADIITRLEYLQEELIDGLMYIEWIKQAVIEKSVSVIRCKDCKDWEQCKHQKEFGVCCRVDFDPPVTRADDFCCYGERKDDV